MSSTLVTIGPPKEIPFRLLKHTIALRHEIFVRRLKWVESNAFEQSDTFY